MPLVVYGVVRRGHPPLRKGDKLGVRLVESGDLAAAVSEIDAPEELTEDDAAQHLDILIMLLRDGPVLPLAFGTVSPDDDGVREEVLTASAEELAQRLDAVDGYVETRLEIFFDEAHVLRELMEHDPELRGIAAQTHDAGAALDARINLGEAVSSRMTEWRQVRADQLLPELAKHVETVAEMESHEPLQQRWAFLVTADRLAGLDEAVAGLRASLGDAASIEYVGPLPVYSFLSHAQPGPVKEGSAWGW